VSKLPETTLAWLRHAAIELGQRDAQTMLHLLERMDALEAAQRQPTPEAAPMATDDSELEEELFELYQKHDTVIGALLSVYDLGVSRCMNTLGRQHGAAQPPAAQPAPPAAPYGGLVERVAEKMGPQSQAAMDAGELPYGAARAAIREVAAALLEWHRSDEVVHTAWEAAKWLEQEAGQ